MQHLQLLHLLEVLLLQAGEQRAAGWGLEAAEPRCRAGVAPARLLTGRRARIVLRRRSSKISPGGIHC